MTWSTGRTPTWAGQSSGGCPGGGFLHARLVPIRPVPGAWLVSGTMSSYLKSGAAQIARAAMEAATRRPELVFRNPEKVQRGWEQMRQDRAAFVEFFGADGFNLGDVRPDPQAGIVWEDAPGVPSTVGQSPDRAIPNTFVASIANGLLKWRTSSTRSIVVWQPRAWSTQS